jgi:hypothetical protein
MWGFGASCKTVTHAAMTVIAVSLSLGNMERIIRRAIAIK